MKRGLVAPVFAAALFACAADLEPHELPVVNIDGTALTRGQLDAYLAVNLAAVAASDGEETERAEQAAGIEEPPADAVRSRLLDAWIDEHLVLIEASERMLAIDDATLDRQIDDPSYDADEGDRESQRAHLRHRLLIELVQSQILQDVEMPTSEAAVLWLEDHPDRQTEGKRVRLRSLRFDSADRAQRVHRELRRNRMTFNEAVLQNAEDDSQGIPTIIDWSALPPEVRQALEKLRRGWSSVPVDLGGSTYLFQVVDWIEPDPEQQIEAARDELYAAARREAWVEFVARLRAAADIRIVQKNLPFVYVSDPAD